MSLPKCSLYLFDGKRHLVDFLSKREGAQPVRGKGRAHPQLVKRKNEHSFSLIWADSRHTSERKFVWMQNSCRLARTSSNSGNRRRIFLNVARPTTSFNGSRNSILA